MIARVWSGATPRAKADAYNLYLSETGAKECLATEGNRGVLVLRRPQGSDATEFLFISLWNSMDVIRRFAGPDVEKAVYYPKDREFLLELAPNVAHYEVIQRES
jgi:hypothetical protein